MKSGGDVLAPAPLGLRLGVVVCIAVTMVVATQLTSRVQHGLDAPFCIMWAHAALMVLCLPGAALARRLRQRGGGGDDDDAAAAAAAGGGGGGGDPGSARAPRVNDVAVFLGLFVGANYSYVRALAYAPPSVVQTVFGSAPAAVAVLSRFALCEPLTPRRVAAVSGSLAGVALVSSAAWGAAGGGRPAARDAAAGVALAQGAVLFATCYKVGFKKKFGTPDPAFVLDFVGGLGAMAALTLLPVAAALVLASVEDGPRTWTAPAAAAVVGGGVVDVFYNLFIALGLSVASPVFVALGTILAIPANVAVDALAFHKRLSPLQYAGAAAIVASFLLLATAPNDGAPPAARDADDADLTLIDDDHAAARGGAPAVPNPLRSPDPEDAEPERTGS